MMAAGRLYGGPYCGSAGSMEFCGSLELSVGLSSSSSLFVTYNHVKCVTVSSFNCTIKNKIEIE